MLAGGAGNDTLFGNDDKDTFIFARNGGFDRVKDFEDTIDFIDVRAFGFQTEAQALASAVQTAGGVQFSWDGTTVLFENTTLAQFDTADFFI